MAARRPRGRSGRPCLLTITGIDHQGKREAGGGAAPRAGPSGAMPSAPVLAAAGGMSSRTACELLQHQAGRHHLDARDADGVLHGEQRDDRFAVDAELVEGLQIGLDARAAAGVDPAMVRAMGDMAPE